MRTTYPRTVTEKIVEYWALGFSASETRQALTEQQGVTVALNTIYKHRHSLTAQNLIDELIRRQERAILKADTDNPELAMRYRNELLKILMPQRIISLSKMETHGELNVNINAQLSEYEQALARAMHRNLQTDNPAEQVDSS